MRGVRWTHEEDLILIDGWADDDIVTIAKKLPGRTIHAAVDRARDLGLGTAHTRWISLTEVAARLGCSFEKTQHLAERAGVTLRKQPRTRVVDPGRRPVGRRWGLDVDDLAAIEARLLVEVQAGMAAVYRASPDGAWGVGGKPDACRYCGETARPHRSRGLCHRCYARAKKAGTLGGYPPTKHPDRRVAA